MTEEEQKKIAELLFASKWALDAIEHFGFNTANGNVSQGIDEGEYMGRQMALSIIEALQKAIAGAETIMNNKGA